MTRLFWYTYICNIIYTSRALHPNDAHSEGYRVSTRSGFPLSDSIDQYLKENRPSDVEYARKKSDIISEYVNYVQRQDKGISRHIDKTVQKQESESLDGDKKVYTMVNKMIRSRGKMIRTLNTPIKTILSRKVGRGLVTCDLGGSTTSHPWNHRPSSTYDEPSDANVRISFDISGVMRLVPIISYVVSSSSAAFMGTLRLLAPLVVFRRALCVLGNLISDWYTGRTLRKTYTRLERIYIHYYETPALFRALTRSFSQWCVYLVLARLMGWCIGLTHPPCRSQGRGLAFLCGLIWIGTVVGTGHAFATAVSLWGGPLRLQAATHPERSSVFGIFTNPWNILQWMQNPEQWIKLIAIPERRRFVPNPIIFPATWLPLHLLQMVAVAMVAATEPDEYFWCSSKEDQIPKLMNKYFVQLSLGDEWQRVFLREKRVGLGICLAIAYAVSMVPLLVTSAMLNRKVTIFMIPSMIAIIVSGWMNMVIYYNRYKSRRAKTAQNTLVNGLFDSA